MSSPFKIGAERLGEYAAFTDESCITAHSHMIVGGVSCRWQHVSTIHRDVLAIKQSYPFPQDSLQWKHTTAAKLIKYKRLVDYALELNRDHILDFIALTIPKRFINNRKYNDGDGETFFQKMMFETYHAVLRKYGRPPYLRAFHGHRESSISLDDTKNTLNSAFAAKAGRPLYRPLIQLEYTPVESSGLHQLADVFLGSVGYHWNASLRTNRESPKSMLAQYFNCNCPLVSLGSSSKWEQRHFNIWEFKLRDPRA